MLIRTFCFLCAHRIKHWKEVINPLVMLNENEKQNVDYYQCIVHDDKGQIGYKSTPTKLVIKEQLEGSGSGSGSGGK